MLVSHEQNDAWACFVRASNSRLTNMYRALMLSQISMREWGRWMSMAQIM